MGKTKLSEHKIQLQLIEWVDNMVIQQKLPKLGLLYSNANGGLRDSRTASLMRAEGQKPGIPDLFWPVASNGLHGLYIELKRPTGVFSKEQLEFKEAVTAEGYGWIGPKSRDEAIMGILSYFFGVEFKGIPDHYEITPIHEL